MKSEYDDCPICCNKRRVSSWVKCPNTDCSFTCCKGCIKKFLLNSNSAIPVCMSCSVEWNFEFLSKNTDEVFHNQEYRIHRAKITLERERSLLPETQELVMQRKRVEKEYKARIREIVDENKKLKAKLRENKNLLYRIRMEMNGRNFDTLPPTLKYKFSSQCAWDDCNGYVKEWKCELCERHTCSKCLQTKESKQDKNHECKKDDVETAKLLRKTKPCPKCKVPIHKISGCDQMYCTSCHTPFSW